MERDDGDGAESDESAILAAPKECPEVQVEAPAVSKPVSKDLEDLAATVKGMRERTRGSGGSCGECSSCDCEREEASAAAAAAAVQQPASKLAEATTTTKTAASPSGGILRSSTYKNAAGSEGGNYFPVHIARVPRVESAASATSATSFEDEESV